MLQLRAFGDSPTASELADQRRRVRGLCRGASLAGMEGGRWALTADVRADVADRALSLARGAGIPAEDVSLLRLEVIGPAGAADESVALVWADLLGQARLNARAAVRYLVFMAVAGVIGAFGVIDEDQILIVGAMAVAPDLLPITAACTGIVLRRARLIAQGLLSLAAGLGLACAVAAAGTGPLNRVGRLPGGFAVPGGGGASQPHLGAQSIPVPSAAGGRG